MDGRRFRFGLQGLAGLFLLLARPHLGVAPGQAYVFYDGDRVLGGGWIARGA